jgi:hypothetical protein
MMEKLTSLHLLVPHHYFTFIILTDWVKKTYAQVHLVDVLIQQSSEH